MRRIALNKPAVQRVGFATGDFNGGGVGDLLFRNLSDGQVFTVQLTAEGMQEPGGGTFATFAATAEVYGVADFDHDGRADVLWGNPNTNHLVVTTNIGSSNQLTTELIAPNTFPADATAGNPPPIQVQAVGDFNGDGYADLLFVDHSTNQARNWDGGATSPTSATFSYSYWTFDSSGTIATNHVVTLPSGHLVVGIANVDGDDRSDLVAKSGSNVWRYAGGPTLGGGGHALLWSNRQTGTVMVWTLDTNGKRLATTYPIASAAYLDDLIAY